MLESGPLGEAWGLGVCPRRIISTEPFKKSLYIQIRFLVLLRFKPITKLGCKGFKEGEILESKGFGNEKKLFLFALSFSFIGLLFFSSRFAISLEDRNPFVLIQINPDDRPIFSSAPLGEAYSIFPRKAGIFDRSSFSLAKEPSEEFNIPIHSYDELEILGYAAAPMVILREEEICPITIYPGYSWVKIWLFRASWREDHNEENPKYTFLFTVSPTDIMLKAMLDETVFARSYIPYHYIKAADCLGASRDAPLFPGDCSDENEINYHIRTNFLRYRGMAEEFRPEFSAPLCALQVRER